MEKLVLLGVFKKIFDFLLVLCSKFAKIDVLGICLFFGISRKKEHVCLFQVLTWNMFFCKFVPLFLQEYPLVLYGGECYKETILQGG